LVTDCHSILGKWKNYFSQILNVFGVNDIRQTERSAREVKLAIAKVRRHKSKDTDQIPAELIKAEGRTTSHKIHTFINSIWNKEELPEEWKELHIVPVYKMGDEADRAYHFCQI